MVVPPGMELYRVRLTLEFVNIIAPSKQHAEAMAISGVTIQGMGLAHFEALGTEARNQIVKSNIAVPEPVVG